MTQESSYQPLPAGARPSARQRELLRAAVASPTLSIPLHAVRERTYVALLDKGWMTRVGERLHVTAAGAGAVDKQTWRAWQRAVAGPPRPQPPAMPAGPWLASLPACSHLDLPVPGDSFGLV